MQSHELPNGRDGPRDASARGWVGLGIGIAALLALTYVVLPLAKRLPLVAPVMEVIERSDIPTSQYWYTQSEETDAAVSSVRNALKRVEKRKNED
jgi:hypothetical protein